MYGNEEGRLISERLTEPWSDYEFSETEMIDAQVTPPCASAGSAVGKGNGVEVAAEAASVWSFREGSLAFVRLFQSRADALETAGLSE